MIEAKIESHGLTGVDIYGDDIELVAFGHYEYGEEISMCTYEETELTGMEGTVTTITVEEGTVTVTREGTVNMQFVFCEGEKHYCAYKTPFGLMRLTVDTQSVYTKLGPRGGEIEVKYALDFMNTGATRNIVKINISEA